MTRRFFFALMTLAFLCILLTPTQTQAEDPLDLSKATVVVRAGDRLLPEQTAAQVLVEEVEKRTGLRWPVSTSWPQKGPVIALTVQAPDPAWEHAAPDPQPALAAEGYRLVTRQNPAEVWILGADGRGVLYGVGHFLRTMAWTPGKLTLPGSIDIATSPAYPLRGHQLGFRARANSWDAWDEAGFERYIRELALFGMNAVENIPFEDATSPVMTVSREQMNLALSRICERYGLEYWIWAPAVFDLKDQVKRAKELDDHEAFFKACPQLDGFFFPGGDPGDNPPSEVLPFLRDVGARLIKYHPNARIWLSMQGFTPEQTTETLDYINREKPAWLGGIASGPSSPPIPETRKRLDPQYPIRHYPDITHTVRCQYETPHWDQAFALTLGRECVNPEPVFYAQVHNFYAPYTNGFITYSDGVHDDVNKVIWLACGWNPNASIRNTLIEYGRLFFGPATAESVADGILALERNWEGPAALNGGIDATLTLWNKLEAGNPLIAREWRGQMCLLRANYDAFIRHRLIYEQQLERDAEAVLLQAPSAGVDAALNAASAVLNRAIDAPVRPDLHDCVVKLCDDLFASIGLQTSVKKYHASGAERGCVLDFLDYPLNNRWWLEDEFTKIRALPGDAEKLLRIQQLATWENPGPGSCYDDIGNIAKSPHVVTGEGINTDPEMQRNPSGTVWWWDSGMSRARLSWQISIEWPIALRYENLDPHAAYTLRVTGYNDAFPLINGEPLTPSLYGKGIGEWKEFPIPASAYAEGTLIITWRKPDEEHLNWRQQSRITEAWLIKAPASS